MKSYMFKYVFISILYLTLQNSWSWAQTYDGMKGYSVYHRYDKSFVTPDLRGKHAVSFGMIMSGNSPFGDEFKPNYGIHLGYNYLIFYKRKKKKLFSKKSKFHDEIKAGLGLHLSVLSHHEFLFTAKYFTPLLPIRGKLMSWYIFSEYGLGLHKLPTTIISTGAMKVNFSLELFRIRIGKTPLNLHFTTNYALSNNLMVKEPIDLGFVGGLRYYFYKNHNK